jgi:hypothetical protein
MAYKCTSNYAGDKLSKYGSSKKKTGKEKPKVKTSAKNDKGKMYFEE